MREITNVQSLKTLYNVIFKLENSGLVNYFRPFCLQSLLSGLLNCSRWFSFILVNRTLVYIVNRALFCYSWLLFSCVKKKSGLLGFHGRLHTTLIDEILIIKIIEWFDKVSCFLCIIIPYRTLSGDRYEDVR